MIISNKTQMYALYEAGAFGNRVRFWNSYDAYRKDTMPCNVGIRYKDPKGGNGPFVGNIEPHMVMHQMLLLIAAGWKEEYMILNESTADKRRTMNGEIVVAPFDGQLYLHYSTLDLHMRDALKAQPEWASGPRAILILKQVMDQNSWDDLEILLHDYPNAAIEFTSFDKPVGLLPRRNTIIWEVRHY